jgi:hypothetical protein
MPSLILIEKTGKLKSIKMDGLDIPNLCKKCGFKSIEGFALAHTWTVAFNEIEYKLCLYGKTEGRANSENKYEFPPPMDNTLFFGSCVVLNMENNEVSDISVKEFEDMMEHLYGGFEDVNSETTESEEETDLPKTKDGYVKDGFIVDSDEGSEGDDNDDDDAEEEEEDDDEEDTEEEVVVKPKRAILPKVSPRKKAVKKEKAAPVLIDCSDELEEEEYLPMV